MQNLTPSQGKALTMRGADGKPHLVSDMKREQRPALPRIRPIVPAIFRLPD
ncbi:hypothetical protein [Devosia sediminis]|uniref:Uncharacterized protein n=1 Tax=Devosia sediminis TaxID=2798801 RepID=A0A934IRR3_9HYPH|nr:hypothetical protein [Devosia sediminis]MBJ3783981.1 hypothetical protein [Devosia sediminis]